MLKTRVIPTLLWKGPGLVKGVGFDSWRRVGSVLPAIKVYNTRQVDELIVLNISATVNDQEPDFDEVNDFSSECFVPLTVGGGIRSIDHIKKMLRAGADKIALNTIIFENPGLITEGANKFGSQCIVVSIDAKKNDRGEYECFNRSGTTPTGRSLVDVARDAEARGAGEILITSIDHDGTMQGYDLKLIKLISDAVKIPVIASGGAGNYNHLFQALSEGGATAVAAASMFHFTEQTPMEAKQFLKEKNVPVRDVNKGK